MRFLRIRYWKEKLNFKITEEDLIIMGVILLGIVVVFGIMTQTFAFSDGMTVFSVAVAALALYYTKRVRGADFNLTEARVTTRTDEFTTIKVLIQNIGDRMGFMRWDTIYIRVKTNIYHLKNPVENEEQLQPDTQTPRGFTFLIDNKEDLTGGMFIASGMYSSHRGKMIEKVWETPLTGNIQPEK